MKTTAVCALLVLATFAHAQWEGGHQTPNGGTPPPNKLPAILSNVGIDQKLNAQAPLDLPFQDESGQTVTLQKYFTDKPVILSLVYFNCTMMCPQVLQGLTTSLRQLKFDIGKDYQVVTVSFDPKDTPQAAAKEKQEHLEQLAKPGAEDGWHFLTGNEDSIRRLTQSVGFRYAWDPQTKQYAHASAIMILTPQGKTSKYFYGIQYSPTDMRFGLIEASHNQIGTPVDQILLFCCRYNATSGKYDLIVSRVLAIAGAITIIILGGLLLVLFRAGSKKNKREDSSRAAA
jgi:protein SCO1